MVYPTFVEFFLSRTLKTHNTKEKLNLSYFDKLKYFNGNGFPSGNNGDIMIFQNIHLELTNNDINTPKYFEHTQDQR